MAQTRTGGNSVPRRANARAGEFRRDGDVWTLSFERHIVRARDAKGLRYIRYLLRRPDEETHALDLTQSENGNAPDPARSLLSDGLRVSDGSLRQDVLDRPAREAYAARVQELDQELSEAASIGDIAAAQQLRDERDQIVAALKAAYGLGGRTRKLSGDPVERARKAVTERIRTTLAQIEKIHPALGDHLRRSVRTGTYCSYAPDERIEWILDDDAQSPPTQVAIAAARLPDVLIVDDHPLWRDTLRKVLEHAGSTVVAEAADGAEALDLVPRLRPEVVLMDIDMPGIGGVEATRAIVSVWPDAKVLVLSSSDERRDVVDVVAAGACGYFLKTADASQIIDAVCRVAAGEPVFPPPLSQIVLGEFRAAHAAPTHRRDLPSGTVTFLFTDIEGSTRLLRQLGDAYDNVLLEHQRILRAAWADHDGHEVKTDGDSFFVAFARATDAIRAAVAAQRALIAHRWPPKAEVRVRMGINTGKARVVAGDYIGLAVHKAARISAAAHGAQIVISRSTRDRVADDLPTGATLVDMGEHRLKDLPDAKRLFQVLARGLPREFPPLRTYEASR